MCQPDSVTMQCLMCQSPIIGQPRESDICHACRQRILDSYDGTRHGAERAELELFAYEFPVCWHCQWPVVTDRNNVAPPPWTLHIHHIYGGPHRKHLRANLARLCDVCHSRAHANLLSKGHVLWLKHLYDRAGYNRATLRTLIHPRILPQRERPPTVLDLVPRRP